MATPQAAPTRRLIPALALLCGLLGVAGLRAQPDGGNAAVGRAELLRTIDAAAGKNDTSAFRALQGAPDATTAELAAMLADRQLTTRQRYFVAFALGWVRTPAALAALLANAGDENAIVRQGIASALWRFRDATGEVAKALGKMAQTDPATYTDRATGALRYTVREVAQRSLANLSKAPEMLQPRGGSPGVGATVAPRAAQSAGPDAAAALATAEAFLSDPALPSFPQRETRFAFKPERRTPYWRLTLEPPVQGAASHLLVTDTNDLVCEYAAALPPGPYPDEALPAAQAREVATEFARRRLPALFAEGAELKQDQEEAISPGGAYVFAFRRVQQRVTLPTQATVGVRAYDGKVVQWQAEHQPLNVALEPKLTRDQALEALRGYLQPFNWAPVQLLEEGLEVLVTDRGQRLMWVLKVETHAANGTRPEELQGLCFASVDAADGAVYGHEFPSLSPRLYRWYAGRGGKRVPAIELRLPDSLFADAAPLPSPDGKRVAFSSTRPRPGYPLWLGSRGSGLFVVNADGSGLSCLTREPAGHPAWGPDANLLGYVSGGILTAVDLRSGEKMTFTGAGEHSYGAFGWLPDGRLVATRLLRGRPVDVVVLQKGQPEAVLTKVAANDDGQGFANLMVEASGRLLYTSKRPPTLGATPDLAPYSVCRLDPQTAQAEVVASGLSAGGRMAHAGPGKVLLSGATGSASQLLDLASGQASAWQFPQVACPGSTFRATVFPAPTDVVFTAGGEMLFSALYFSGTPGEDSARVVYACAADGSGARLLTTPARQAAAPYVFPATGQPAF